jgi:hypothetical protein
MNDEEFEFLVLIAALPAAKRQGSVAKSNRSPRDGSLSVLAKNVLDVLLGQDHNGLAVKRWHSLVENEARKSIS